MAQQALEPRTGAGAGAGSAFKARFGWPVLHFEQAVYGSFPFWDRGYAFLAQSPGCRPEWLADLRATCQRFGEPPRGWSQSPGLFALRLPSGPWAIVGVSAPATDDQGRPGALAFHALFVAHREFRKAGYNPFLLAAALHRHWGPETAALPAGSWVLEPRQVRQQPLESEWDWVVRALTKRRRVALESGEPIERLASAVWDHLPLRVRKRASVATLAYGTSNRFHLLALPRLTGASLDREYVTRETFGASEDRATLPHALRAIRPGWLVVGAAAVLVASGLALGLFAHGRGAPTGEGHGLLNAAQAVETGPDRSSYPDEPIDPEERARVVEGLIDLAERYGIVKPGEAAAVADPATLMSAISERLRYQGPWLSAAERASLERERSPERERALAMHAQVLSFAAGRPLPSDFKRGPLRWQLDTLAWSFYHQADRRQSPAEVPLALANALAVEGTVRPSRLAARYPALGSYAQFLAHLPRR
ncbi:MAG TPA: hypothetical protein VGY53_01355 [Isosphaeraceae bacterium]|jgi:hypothetical protein|nr:hypothetical protein [Isosphaeraceae bacterium]